IADFAPITALATNEFVLVANATVPVRTFAEFLAYAKARPGKSSYGSAGVGTPNQLILEQLAQSANFSMVHVPYKGGAAAVADLVGGQIDFMMAGLAPALPHIRVGKLTALAVPQPRRSGALPDVPTIGETLTGFATKSWFGLFAPRGVPPDIVTRLNREVRAVLEASDLRSKLAQQGLVAEASAPNDLAEMVRNDIARYRVLAKQLNIEAN
ncbi:MAG: tripartite tricarboxylate transporter substrate-binding protein, partial [Burkholderiales bacterium]